MKTLSIFAVLIVAFVTSPLAAQKGATHVSSSFEGHCELTLPNVPTGSCNSGVLWLVMQNGRSNVTFTFTDDRRQQTTFSLAGGKDRQPNPDNYLSVDTLRTNFYNTKELVTDTEGECHFSLNEPGTRYYYIRCLIYNRRQGITFNFTLNDIQTFETKAF